MKKAIYFVVVILSSFVLLAQQSYASRQVTSGTGFFVSNRGHIVTNEHVVKGCGKVLVRGAVEPQEASVISYDEENDLALLKTSNTSPRRIATLRLNDSRVHVGDNVVIVGYPLNRGVTGEYEIRHAKVTGLDGPMNENKWIQFSDSIAQGNSGGPLLDSSGNVVGVVVGKATLMRSNRVSGKQEVVQKSDLAISLDVLQNFLNMNNIQYKTSASPHVLSTSRIEYKAQDFIVNVHCQRKPMEGKQDEKTRR